jgi:tetratricopeptide (TPR) repeat protein
MPTAGCPWGARRFTFHFLAGNPYSPAGYPSVFAATSSPLAFFPDLCFHCPWHDNGMGVQSMPEGGAMQRRSKIHAWVSIVVSVMLLLTGCAVNSAVKKQYRKIKNETRGEYYLETEQYRKGISVFSELAELNPRDPWTHYYLGRFYLADGKPKPGLRHLKTAAKLEPADADIQFWTGVAHYANKNRKAERSAYKQALDIKPDHLQALAYLGHNLFSAGKLEEALALYERSLDEWPGNPQVLYNRGLILKRLKRDPEERQAWLAYLDRFPAGAFARKAASKLNAAGHFDFRTFRIGRRQLTLEKIHFVPLSERLTDEAEKSLYRLGSIFSRQRGQHVLHILVYQKNNKKLAQKRADSIRRYLLAEFPELSPERVRNSWFPEPERITIGKKRFLENASVRFFTAGE